MTKVDNSYMERLEEVVFDEKKVINYKGVSVMLGVHVNIAKQMLYHFYKTQKEKGKPIFATYFVSGMLPRKMLAEFRSNNSSEEEASLSESAISSELDAFLVLICRDLDLERYKAKFTKIFSIHIYALSGFPLENFDPLESLANERLSDSEGRTPVDFGPITCKAAEKFRQHIPIPQPPPPSVQKNESKVKKEDRSQSQDQQSKDKKTDEPENVKDEGETPAKATQKKTTTIIPPGKNDKDRLKNMFATAASKPKVKKEEKQKMEVDKPNSKATSTQFQKSSKSSTASKNKSNGDSRKRKRIRDVLSSESEEDDEEKKSDQDDESDSPESPLPKRMQRVIESDSEDDDVKERIKKEPESAPPAPIPSKPGKKHVTKTVKKSYVDKDGYLVTTREKVIVSEDEEETISTPADVPTQKDSDNNNSDPPQTQNESKKKAIPPSKPKNTASAAVGKTKQASLMSFFSKK